MASSNVFGYIGLRHIRWKTGNIAVLPTKEFFPVASTLLLFIHGWKTPTYIWVSLGMIAILFGENVTHKLRTLFLYLDFLTYFSFVTHGFTCSFLLYVCFAWWYKLSWIFGSFYNSIFRRIILEFFT